jgi:hypothetical protein
MSLETKAKTFKELYHSPKIPWNVPLLTLEDAQREISEIKTADEFRITELTAELEQAKKEVDKANKLRDAALVYCHQCPNEAKIEAANKILGSLNSRGMWATEARVNVLDRTALMCLAIDFDKIVTEIQTILSPRSDEQKLSVKNIQKASDEAMKYCANFGKDEQKLAYIGCPEDRISCGADDHSEVACEHYVECVPRKEEAKNPWSEIKEDVLPGLQEAMQKCVEKEPYYQEVCSVCGWASTPERGMPFGFGGTLDCPECRKVERHPTLEGCYGSVKAFKVELPQKENTTT